MDTHTRHSTHTHDTGTRHSDRHTTRLQHAMITARRGDNTRQSSHTRPSPHDVITIHQSPIAAPRATRRNDHTQASATDAATTRMPSPREAETARRRAGTPNHNAATMRLPTGHTASLKIITTLTPHVPHVRYQSPPALFTGRVRPHGSGRVG